MSIQSNPYSQGGGGNTFELNVQSAYFVWFLLGGCVPGLPSSRITYFRQQARSLGYSTDDVLLRCEDELGERRLLFQIKHQIAATAENDTFIEVITSAWKDFNNDKLFTPAADKIYLITTSLPKTVRNHLLPVLSWAKSKTTLGDYLNEVNRIAQKKHYFDVFKTIISVATPTVTDDEVLRFLKCYEVLEYDLDEDSSVTKNYVLNCISLAKNTGETARSIWNAVFALLADSNPEAGEYTLETRPATILAKLNKPYLSDTQRTLLRLSARSQELLDGITDKIGPCHLDRAALVDNASSKLSDAQLLIVTGEAGAGKSAVAKTLVAQSQERGSGYVLCFKADELLTGQLRDWFYRQHITQDIRDIFSHFALLPNAVIYVDSMERLLEAEALPFRQLLKALQDLPSIKLIGSCRKSLLNLITQKFFSSTTTVPLDIPYLSDAELQEVSRQVPTLRPAIENKELQELIRIPKYLDFAFLAIQDNGGNYRTMSEVQFQQTLWSAIVENVLDGSHHGLPARRSESFIDISVVRSRKMEVYVPPTKPDFEALEALQKETVLLQYQQKRLYAPPHDVLEDWALTRYADRYLSSAAAVRRSLQLWGQSPPCAEPTAFGYCKP
jgi:hypothetical protein